MSELSAQERFKRGAVDAPRYFRFMADFVGFTPEDAQTIRETRLVVEKHLPAIIGEFYAQLLRFPATRKVFLKKDGSLDQDYLELRMQHQANFWRRTMTGVFDEDYARFVDYVGRAHTSQGADPRIYISERYVIGMVGFMQQRIAEALAAELHAINPDLESRGLKAWSALLTVLTEQLSRVYGEGKEPETYQPQEELNEAPLHEMAEDSYERASGLLKPARYHRVAVGPVDSIPEGERKIVDAEGHSVGVFHHNGRWYALSNSCLHRGGPVCTGTLEGDVITCPWHGYQYDITTGELLLDHATCLPTYKVTIEQDQVYVEAPVYARGGQRGFAGRSFRERGPRRDEGSPAPERVPRRGSPARPGRARCGGRRGRGSVQRRWAVLCDAERVHPCRRPLERRRLGRLPGDVPRGMRRSSTFAMAA